MKQIATGFTKCRALSGLSNLHWGLIKLMAIGLMASANQASAAYVYQMAGGECQDSNHVTTLISPPGAPEVYQAGPKLCSDHVSVQVTMRDDYVPGTPFSYESESPDQVANLDMKIKSFSFSDGARSVTTNFAFNFSGGYVRGVLPANGEPTDFGLNWVEGFFFEAKKDGTWLFALEDGANGKDYCGRGSTEGPNGVCKFTRHYESVGTYDGWVRVPEPPVIPMLGLSLSILAGLTYKRRKNQI